MANVPAGRGDGSEHDLLPEVEPWERQPNESEEAWLAFRTYRDLDPPRFMRDVQKHFADQGEPRHMQLYRGWSARHRWRDRAHIYDLHMERVRQRAKEKAVQDMAERHARIAGAGIMKVMQRLIGNEQAGIAGVDMNEVEFRDVINAFSTLVKVERVSRGEPADRTAAEHSGPGGAPIPMLLQSAEPAEGDPEEDAKAAATVLAVLVEQGVIQIAPGVDEPVATPPRPAGEPQTQGPRGDG